MSTPEQHKINALEAELAEYAALPLADRLIPSTAALITAKENRLTRLLDAQAASAGKSSVDAFARPDAPSEFKRTVLFTLEPAWKNETPRIRSQVFHHPPTVEQLRRAACHLFDITIYEAEDERHENFALWGRLGSEYFEFDLNNFELGDDANIVIRPLYHTCTLKIQSWAQEHSRKFVMRALKELGVVGEITRISSVHLSLRLFHPYHTKLDEATHEITSHVGTVYNVDGQEVSGVMDLQFDFGYGALTNAVKKTRGTAVREDGIASDGADDTMSETTLFNV